jgi:hypothetical protein
MVRSQDVQTAVESLAARVESSILIEDVRFQPLWWSAQDAVDGHRLRSIMQRSIHPAALAMVKRLDLARADGPVHTPAVAEADLLARWCLPLRRDSTLLGYLWMLDHDGAVSDDSLRSALETAAIATAYLAETAAESDQRDQRRAELLQLLASSPNQEACRELVALERLKPDRLVVVQAPGRADGWQLAEDLSAHVVPSTYDGATSGAPVAIADLHVATYRARMTQRALSAGARLERPSWDRLGAWHLVVAAPAGLNPASIHPGAQQLAELAKPDLLVTTRTILEMGGDVAKAAAVLHIHRTTLYYRLDRICELTGVDLRTSPDRFDLQMALRLAAFREVGTE